MTIGARLAGAFVFRTANLEDVIRTTMSKFITAYTNLDNVRDELSPSEPRIHKNYSTGFACCEHSRQSSYSENVSFGVECYEEITVKPRPPKLDNCNGNKLSGMMNPHLHYS
ncbi:hypothetical protein TNCV_4732511 [Trichonephila clavipes]|nr:hypothetical protein TNCV_4732511 [Trichonephila clavipes]